MFETFLTVLDQMDAYPAVIAKENTHYLPLAENFRGGSDLFIDICHMTPEGIDQKANLMAQHLIPHLEPHLR